MRYDFLGLRISQKSRAAIFCATSSQADYTTETPVSSSMYGVRSIIRILTVSNSMRLEAKPDATAFENKEQKKLENHIAHGTGDAASGTLYANLWCNSIQSD